MEKNKVINAILLKKEDEDIYVINLKFKNELEINISKNDESNLNNIFSKILENALDEKFEFELSVDNSCKNQTIIEIAKGYIFELNKELNEVYQEDIFKEIYDKKE